MNSNKPVAKYNAGNITVAVWQNEFTHNQKTVTALRASIERRFKTKDGQWKSSSTFSRNDIPLAVYCLQKAFDYMVPNSKNDLKKNKKPREGDYNGSF